MNTFDVYTELLGLPNVVITDFNVTKKVIEISCTLTNQITLCPHCGTNCTVVNDKTTRRLRDLNIAEREVFLLVTVRQFRCPTCGSCPTEQIDFAESNKSYTHRQAKFVFMLCQKQSYTEIGAIVNMHSKTVERLVLNQCKNTLNLSNRYAQVKRLGIDEQSHRKGKKDYICLLTNLDTGTIVDILPNRKKETLVAHFKALGKGFCNQITDVSCDIWTPYISTIETCFPNANLILDRFHVVKLLNESLDNFRKQLRKDNKDEVAFKKLKWILFKQYHRLTDTQIDELDAGFVLSPELKEYYFLREKFHHILDNQNDVDVTITLLDEWVKNIQEKKITIFDSFIKTLQNHKQYIANFVKDNLSNAVTEGLNNLVRSIRRCAFGMPNFNNLRLRVMAISM
jgi:transposase